MESLHGQTLAPRPTTGSFTTTPRQASSLRRLPVSSVTGLASRGTLWFTGRILAELTSRGIQTSLPQLRLLRSWLQTVLAISRGRMLALILVAGVSTTRRRTHSRSSSLVLPGLEPMACLTAIVTCRQHPGLSVRPLQIPTLSLTIRDVTTAKRRLK